jgi:hypothetical protein
LLIAVIENGISLDLNGAALVEMGHVDAAHEEN